MYVTGNPKSKKQIKEWMAEGKRVTVFSLSPFEKPPFNGTVYIEGPHYPQPHKFYAQAIVENSVIKSIK